MACRYRNVNIELVEWAKSMGLHLVSYRSLLVYESLNCMWCRDAGESSQAESCANIVIQERMIFRNLAVLKAMQPCQKLMDSLLLNRAGLVYPLTYWHVSSYSILIWLCPVRCIRCWLGNNVFFCTLWGEVKVATPWTSKQSAFSAILAPLFAHIFVWGKPFYHMNNFQTKYRAASVSKHKPLTCNVYNV